MKFLVAMCLMAAGASASYGESGIVHPDGTLQQFTPEEAANIAAIGDSGVVFHDGTHLQFDYDTAAHHANLPAAPLPVPVMLENQGRFGHSGIVYEGFDNVQFTPAQAEEIVLIGPSGVVKNNGMNVQLNEEGLPSRKKRSYGAVVGPAGLITPDGKLIQLKPGVSVVSAGASAALLSTGEAIPYYRKKRAASKAVVGDSGVITPGGKLIQLPHGVEVVLAGPSALLLSNGDSIQYEF